MRTVPAPPTLVLLLGVLVTLLTACDGDLRADSDHEPSARSSIPQTAGPAPSAPRAAEVDTARADDPYVGVGRLLHGHGVRIWWESDLVARWLEGPASFEGAIRRLGMLARQPGTAGIKVADEIGYHDGLGTPARAMAFLRATRAALTRVAPGKPILVDAVVLELGCMPRTAEVMACEARARADAPAATISAMTSYLNAHLIDRLDLSTGLEDPAPYPDHSLSEAQDLAWTYVAAGPWPRLTALQSRKALAEPGGFSGGADGAAAAARTYIDVPRVHGAQGTDIWAWRQDYRDETVSLFGDHPTHNPLWPVLLAEHRRGVRLFTHMTPRSLPTNRSALAGECALASEMFTDVFLAAGTG